MAQYFETVPKFLIRGNEVVWAGGLRWKIWILLAPLDPPDPDPLGGSDPPGGGQISPMVNILGFFKKSGIILHLTTAYSITSRHQYVHVSI